MEYATPVLGAITVLDYYEFEGNHWLHVPCPNGYWSFTELPVALNYRGRIYGRSGHNSDRNIAYYTTRQAFAIKS